MIKSMTKRKSQNQLERITHLTGCRFQRESLLKNRYDKKWNQLCLVPLLRKSTAELERKILYERS